jgi:hypothetical protein
MGCTDDPARADAITPSPTGTVAEPSATASPKMPSTAVSKLGPTAGPKAVARPISSEERAAAFPTVTPLDLPSPRFVDGIPEGAVGPLLVYERTVRRVAQSSGPGINNVVEVVTYDLGAARAVASSVRGDRDATAPQVQLAGRELLVDVRDSTSKRLLRLDGTQSRTLQPQTATFPWRVIPSPDGKLFVQDVPEGLVIGSLDSSEVLHRVSGPTRPREPLAPAAWAADGQWVIAQEVNPHRASGLWVLTSDGVLRELAHGGSDESRWEVAPDGRFAALRTEHDCPGGGTVVGDICAWAAKGFTVRDLATNRDIASVRFNESASISLHWDSRGERLLYSRQRPSAAQDERDVRNWGGPREWHTLDLRTGVSALVIDVSALERGEVAPWSVVFDCTSRNGSRYRLPVAPGATWRGDECDQLWFDGSPVGSGPDIRMLGMIEVR